MASKPLPEQLSDLQLAAGLALLVGSLQAYRFAGLIYSTNDEYKGEDLIKEAAIRLAKFR